MEKFKQLFFDGPLATGAEIDTPHPLARRLSRVLRLRENNRIALFNGRDGLFLARISAKNAEKLTLEACLKPQPSPRRATLMIALLKKEAMDTVLRQATEFGISHIQPVECNHCVSTKLNPERAKLIVQEAAEQCERLTLPEIMPTTPLREVIEEAGGTIFWCAERQR